jgi:hypothetical protein
MPKSDEHRAPADQQKEAERGAPTEQTAASGEAPVLVLLLAVLPWRFKLPQFVGCFIILLVVLIGLFSTNAIKVTPQNSTQRSQSPAAQKEAPIGSSSASSITFLLTTAPAGIHPSTCIIDKTLESIPAQYPTIISCDAACILVTPEATTRTQLKIVGVTGTINSWNE